MHFIACFHTIINDIHFLMHFYIHTTFQIFALIIIIIILYDNYTVSLI